MTTLFVALFTVAVLAMVGLVYEGGTYLEAKRAARHAAVGAARAGAQELDEGRIRDDGTFNALDRDAARTAACNYLNNTTDPQYGVSCSDAVISPEVEGITVRVTAEIDVRLAPGLSHTVTEEGHACAEAGITDSYGLCDN